jgi:N6-L-threonylcarbamoyladenine synthase
MKIIGIETSCDETAVSIIEAQGDFPSLNFKTLVQLVSSQVAVHAPWGGVVPSLAKREHLTNLPPLVERALSQTKLTPADIDLIAVTYGPGLEPALWVGFTYAQELAAKWGKHWVGVNHMAGHIWSVLADSAEQITLPALALLVSGGHTELVLMRDWLQYQIIGQTRDDAVGEAFDKVARLLGLPYPGGPEIGRLASHYHLTPNPYQLPRPMINSKDLDFSFSGLKTAVLYLIKKIAPLDENTKSAIAYEFQQAVIDVLLAKTLTAINQHQPTTLIIAGGVAANIELITQFKNRLSTEHAQIKVLTPSQALSGDNATMIAMAGYCQYLQQDIPTPTRVEGNLKLSI